MTATYKGIPWDNRQYTDPEDDPAWRDAIRDRRLARPVPPTGDGWRSIGEILSERFPAQTAD